MNTTPSVLIMIYYVLLYLIFMCTTIPAGVAVDRVIVRYIPYAQRRGSDGIS